MAYTVVPLYHLVSSLMPVEFNVSHQMTHFLQTCAFVAFALALSSEADASSITKAPICAKAIRQLLIVSKGECVRAKATYLVVGRSDTRQEVELVSLAPTQSFKAWAECIEENWSRTEAGKNSRAGVGTKVAIELAIGDCES